MECKRGPERTTSGSTFSNIASIYLKNRNIASILKKKIETRRLVSSQWKKYIKYYVYHVTDLTNEIVRKPHHM
jgi:hypothetical protein